MKSLVLAPPRSYEPLRSLLPDVEESHLDSETSLGTYVTTTYTLEEECARVKARRDAEAAFETGLKRKKKAQDKARRLRAEEEAKRERTNREAMVIIERMEHEARVRANLPSQETAQNPSLCARWKRSSFQYRSLSPEQREGSPFVESL